MQNYNVHVQNVCTKMPIKFYNILCLNLILTNLIQYFKIRRHTCTPDMAFTTVDLPCATWPMVPILMVACRLITSGVRGVNF